MTKKVYRANVSVEDKFRMRIKARDHELIFDEPAPISTNGGMTPLEGFLGALGACKGIVAKATAMKQKIPFDSIEIELAGDFDSAGYNGDPNVPIGFSNIRTIYHIQSSAPREAIEALIKHVESHCPVAATITDSAPLESELKLNEIE